VEEHRTAVVEVVAEADHLARFVAQHDVERKLRVEVLRHVDRAREGGRGGAVLHGRDGEKEREDHGCAPVGGCWGAWLLGCCCRRCTASCLATSMGTRT